jgi:aldehyde dehydrogenase (NAD+)
VANVLEISATSSGPAVFSDVQDYMKIAKEELFGPVMIIIPFKDIDEVICRSQTAYGLVAAVWDHDIKKARSVADRLRAGTVWMNWYNVVNVGAPFDSFKQSGFGRESEDCHFENCCDP